MICLYVDLGRCPPLCGFQKKEAQGGSNGGKLKECTACPWPGLLSMAAPLNRPRGGSRPQQLCLRRSVVKSEHWSFLTSSPGDSDMQPGLELLD